jgi:hypothetical protein
MITGTFTEMKELERLIVDGIREDEGHHKQWYLEQIATLVGIDIEGYEFERGIAP